MKYILIIMICLNGYAQEYTTLRPNINPKSALLKHVLNEQQDTLLLNGVDLRMVKLNLNGTDEGRRYVENLNTISLSGLKLGKYTVIVYTYTNIIVFNIERLREFEKRWVKEVIPKKAYNLSNKDRRNSQSRSEYRNTNLRPNGKPYNK